MSVRARQDRAVRTSSATGPASRAAWDGSMYSTSRNRTSAAAAKDRFSSLRSSPRTTVSAILARTLSGRSSTPRLARTKDQPEVSWPARKRDTACAPPRYRDAQQHHGTHTFARSSRPRHFSGVRPSTTRNARSISDHWSSRFTAAEPTIAAASIRPSARAAARSSSRRASLSPWLNIATNPNTQPHSATSP